MSTQGWSTDIDEPLSAPGTRLATFGPACDGEVTRLRILPRADAGFVTHLIAIQQQLPQTRTLRRASSADALAAYHSTAHRDDRAPAARIATRRSV